jgi:MoaA/NifB/PqqE/SkfB family radical SAM enzyme
MKAGYLLKLILGEKLKIPFLFFWIGTECALRCKDCCNLIPYTVQRAYDFMNSIDDLKKIAGVAKIELLQIQGGEPFAHPDMDKFVHELLNMNISNIYIPTNGTVLLNEMTIKAIQAGKDRIQIGISSYDCSKEQIKRLVKQLEENNISYYLYDLMYSGKSGYYAGGISEIKNDNDMFVRKIYDHCENKVCHTLADGRLTICGRGIAAKEIYGIPKYRLNDELNIREKKAGLILKIMLFRFLNSGKFREYCRYCLGTYYKVPGAVRIERTMNDPEQKYI